MKYELGDKVSILKHWKRITVEEFLKGTYYIPNNLSLEDHLMSDGMAGDSFKVKKYINIPINETGIIVGKRKIKTEYDLEYITQQEYTSDGIQQVDYKQEEIYLVATRMNCLRKVSFEDIRFIS